MKQLLELMKEVRKFAGYKINNTQDQLNFYITMNNQKLKILKLHLK